MSVSASVNVPLERIEFTSITHCSTDDTDEESDGQTTAISGQVLESLKGLIKQEKITSSEDGKPPMFSKLIASRYRLMSTFIL